MRFYGDHLIKPQIILLISQRVALKVSAVAMFVSPNALIKSTQADTSASDALEISKNRLRSVCDSLEFPSARFKITDAIARLIWSVK